MKILGKFKIDSGCRGKFQNRWRDPARGDIVWVQGFPREQGASSALNATLEFFFGLARNWSVSTWRHHKILRSFNSWTFYMQILRTSAAKAKLRWQQGEKWCRQRGNVIQPSRDRRQTRPYFPAPPSFAQDHHYPSLPLVPRIKGRSIINLFLLAIRPIIPSRLYLQRAWTSTPPRCTEFRTCSIHSVRSISVPTGSSTHHAHQDRRELAYLLEYVKLLVSLEL